MKDILTAPFMVESIRLLSNCYRLGWDERNGGNLSYILEESDYAPYIDGRVIRTIPLGFDASALVGKVFLVTGTGKYFKNAEYEPDKTLGIVRIAKDGANAELLWGFSDGGKFTSEFPSHLMTHAVRLTQDNSHRVVLHCHPTNVIAMTMIEPLEDKAFSKTLWKSNTECIVVFPEGVGVLPWMLCGTPEIGMVTAEKMKNYRTVIWANHGIFGTGTTLDECFGLVETVEKTAQIYMLTIGREIKNTISDSDLTKLVNYFRVKDKVKAGWLD